MTKRHVDGAYPVASSAALRKLEAPFCYAPSPNAVVSNFQLIDTLASAANFPEEHKKSYIGNILFNDSIDHKGHGGSWSFGSDNVSGGSMGRDHTLNDVPNHFVRDFLLFYTNDIEGYTEEQKKADRNALFPDLTPEDIKDYSALLAKKKEHGEEEEIRKFRREKIMFSYDVQSKQQAEAILRQPEVVGTIIETVDLEPLQTPVAIRQYEKLKPLTYSVLKPNESRSLEQHALEPPTSIDRNCDQVQLMIRRFCYREDVGSLYNSNDNDFTMDQFQKAIGIHRPQMTEFLEKRGPKDGTRIKAYHLACEFFKKREMLGYPLKKDGKKSYWVKTTPTVKVASVRLTIHMPPKAIANDAAEFQS